MISLQNIAYRIFNIRKQIEMIKKFYQHRIDMKKSKDEVLDALKGQLECIEFDLDILSFTYYRERKNSCFGRG